jgi:hypothetical protein
MKRHQVVDPTTGRVDLRYNPLSIEEDYFIPIRGGASGTEIINLPGGQFTGTVEDVKYLREKLFAALKVPQSYLVMGEGASEDKTTLAQKDIRFARTIQRLQRVVIAELEKIGIIHLFTLGFRGDDLLAFDLALNNPSKIAELQELEHWKTKFDVAGAATEGFFSMRWIAEHMFGISEDEFIRMQREMFFDRKFMANLEAAGQAPESAPSGDLDFKDDDMPTPETPEPETPEAEEPAPAAEDEGVLLATPAGNRPDDRGPYKKHQLKYRKGGFSKQMKNQATGEYGNTARSIFKGKTGYGGLDSLARGITENKTLDKIEEEKLFSTSTEVNKLLESLKHLENKENESKAQ